MKKHIKLPIMLVVIFLIITVATTGVSAWFIATTTRKHKVKVSVIAPQDLEIVFSDETGSLSAIHGNAVSFYDQDGNATTNYYHATVTCTFDGTKTLYFDGIISDSDLLPALRVVIDKKIYAGEGFTTGIKVNDMPVLPQTSGSLGTYTDKAVLDVIVFLEGEDAACVNKNFAKDIEFELEFSVDE